MHLVASPTELTTAATDAVLGVLCLAVLWRLAVLRVSATWKRGLWCWVFGLLTIACVLGTVVHGLELPEPVRVGLWHPLNLSLGLTVGLFLVGGVYDWRGEGAARALLPWAMALGVGFFVITQFLGGLFLTFVIYEAAALTATLAMYIALGTAGRLPGAGTVALGIGLSIVAAAIQASTLSVRVIVPFDHNGLFHLVQLVATAVLAIGLRRGLLRPPNRAGRVFPGDAA